MKIRHVIFFLASLAVSSCSTSLRSEAPIETSVTQIVASPYKYEGVLLKLRVFAVTSVEGTVLFDTDMDRASVNAQEDIDSSPAVQAFVLKSFGVGGKGNPKSVQATVVGKIKVGRNGAIKFLISDATNVSVQ